MSDGTHIPVEVWYRVGTVERGPVYRIRRVEAYSLRRDGMSQPWKTKREARGESASAGCRARFQEKEVGRG